MAQLRVGIIIFSAVICYVCSSSEYGNCVVYEADEDNDSQKDQYCKDIDGNTYCLEWDCLPTSCTNPITEAGSKCPYCPGTCTYGGRIHSLYERFTCPDGVNSCSCSYNNAVRTSFIKVNSPDEMCKPED